MEKKKKRRVKDMEEVRKELEIKEEEEILDITREFMRMARENWINGFQLCLSIWEESLKIPRNQIEQLISVQEEYATFIKEVSKRLPTKIVSLWSDNLKSVSASLERILFILKEFLKA